jgi:hypothetical protein
MVNRSFHFIMVALFVSSLLQTHASAPQAEPRKSAVPQIAELGTGKWWLGLTDEAKVKFIERYASAMNRVSSELLTQCGEGMKSLDANAAQEVDVMSAMILCKVGASFDFSFEGKQLIEGVDQFYKHSTNLSVPVDVALQDVRDNLAAKRPHPSFGSWITASPN